MVKSMISYENQMRKDKMAGSFMLIGNHADKRSLVVLAIKKARRSGEKRLYCRKIFLFV
jgi:hypothetical protein